MNSDAPHDSDALSMAAKSTDDLYKIVSFKDQFSEEVYAAAREELRRRENVTSVAPAPDPTPVAETAPKADIDIHPNLLSFSKEYLVTPLILYANVLVFIVMAVAGVNVFDPPSTTLADWGGNLGGLTLNGEVWRLFTCMFLHAGFFHLAANVYPLLLVGSVLEIHIGKVRYAVSYIVCGIMASISSVVYHENTVSVGASGAIFGLFGLLLSLLLTKSLNVSDSSRKNLLAAVGMFTVYNLIGGFREEGIDNAAHIGGLVCGAIIGFLYSPSLRHGESSRIATATIAGIALATALLLPSVFSTRHSEYYAVLEEFGDTEEKAVQIYHVSRPTVGSRAALRYKQRVQTESIDLWKRSIAQLHSLRNLSSEQQARVDLLVQYCALRIEVCELLQQSVTDGDEGILEKIQKIDGEIENIVQELHHADDAEE